MDELIKQFPHAYIRDYKGGKEIRVRDFEHSLSRAKKIIEKNNLPLEIFNQEPQLRSFSVRNKD